VLIDATALCFVILLLLYTTIFITIILNLEYL